MMETISYILGFLAIISGIAMVFSWILSYFKFRNINLPSFHPKVSVIIPCKGIDKDFTKNILSICNQDYTKYDLIFVTDSEKDPAYETLIELVGKKDNIKIVFSKYIKGSSGKISALIQGVKEAGDTEVYVFADSDIKPHKAWLTSLVSPLKNETIGATTGYRWYFPSGVSSLILSVWNMTQSISSFFQTSTYCWGGSTAIRKELFEKLNIVEQWKKGFSDDLILTNALKKSKHIIQFIPQCIVESPSEGNLQYILKWGTQQLTWIRWYYPLWWIISVVGMIGLQVLTILGFILIIYGVYIPGIMMISLLAFEMISGGVAHIVLKSLMQYPKKRHISSLTYALITPVIYIILAYNNLTSIFKNEIQWGGRIYKKRDMIPK